MIKEHYDFEKGEMLLINKPYKWTSFDVVKKLKFALKIKKIGHAGTLDPLATGLLILCTGKMTKQIETYQSQGKEYTGKFVLGATTPSFDLETEVSEAVDISNISEDRIKETIKKFTGIITQIPPQYSAVKVNGERAYKNARKGIKVAIKSREVTVSNFEITDINLPEVEFKINCSKGTYIRSLANDLGAALGVGAYLSELKRTKIGDFGIEDAFELAEFIKHLQPKMESTQ